jgi:iron complex outermembrane receptor protein
MWGWGIRSECRVDLFRQVATEPAQAGSQTGSSVGELQGVLNSHIIPLSMNVHPIRRSRSILSVALIAGASMAGRAQTAPPTSAPTDAEPVKLATLVVTGSRITGPAGSAAVPVNFLGTEDIASAGVATDILDLLRKVMPQFTGNANLGLENAGNVAFFSMGGSAISMHNLNTLVLINGRRVAFSPAEAAIGNQFVDVNMIPPSAIDRIEVLSDGASAIYGSDAVGGVVNIILKPAYRGWEAGVHWGESSNRGDYTERSGYLTGGTSNATTSLMISIEGTSTSPVFMKQRPYTNPIFGTTSYPGIIDIVSFQTGADTFYRLNPANNAPPPGGLYTIDQLVQMGVYTPQTPAQVVAGYNLANQQTLLASLKRHSMVADFEHNILGDKLVLFGDAIYAATQTQSSLNGQSMTPYVSTPTLDFAQYGTSPAPPGFAYLPATQANSPFSPDWLDQGNLVTVHNRFSAYSVLTQADSDFYRLTGGLKGTISPDYSWEGAAVYNRYHLDYQSPGQINTANLNAAFAAGTIDPFAYTQAAGSLPGEVIGTRTNNMTSTLAAGDVLFRASPLALPAGKLGLVAGASCTRERLSAAPDANSLPDAMGIPGWQGFQSFSPFNALRDISSLYAELKIPILGAAQAIPGLHELTLSLAGRYDNYTVVGHSTVPEASVLYRPADDQFSLRASAGKSFSAPTLFELFGPVQSGQIPPVTFNNYGGGQTEQAVFNGFGGSNPGLQPAKASTWSAGFVFAPHSAKGFSVSADYFQVVDKGEIGYLSIPAIVQGVELQGPASPYAPYVHIGGPAAPGVTGPGQLSTANPSNVFVQVPLINLASQAVKGFDATLNWTGPTTSAGTFSLGSSITVYNSYLLQAIPTEDYFQYAGHASGGSTSSSSQGTIPRWRTYTTLEWKYAAIDARIGHTFVPSVTDIGPGGDAASPPVSVGSYQQIDLLVGYDFGKTDRSGWLGKLVLRVGVNNLFNKMPPLAPNAFPSTNADVGSYNGAIGRLFFVDASYRF